MFERLERRAREQAEARAEVRRRELALALSATAPRGIMADVEGEAVVLSGRGLARRSATEPGLRWMVQEALDER